MEGLDEAFEVGVVVPPGGVHGATNARQPARNVQPLPQVAADIRVVVITPDDLSVASAGEEGQGLPPVPAVPVHNTHGLVKAAPGAPEGIAGQVVIVTGIVVRIEHVAPDEYLGIRVDPKDDLRASLDIPRQQFAGQVGVVLQDAARVADGLTLGLSSMLESSAAFRTRRRLS